MLVSQLLDDAASLIEAEGWITGAEVRRSGRCLTGALGEARRRSMTRPERREIRRAVGFPTWMRTRTHPFMIIVRFDETLRRAVAICSSTFQYQHVPPANMPICDHNDADVMSRRVGDLISWNDNTNLSCRHKVIELFRQAAEVARELETEDTGWPTDADIEALYTAYEPVDA